MSITGIDALTFGVTDLDESHRFLADWGLLGAPDDPTRALVRAAFATRRKTLTNALTAAGVDRAALVGALEELGLPLAVRAEDISPSCFAQMSERLAWTG